MADLPSPFHYVSGLSNFRSLGSHPIPSLPGHTTTPSLVFRSAEPSRLTPTGTTALQSLRIARVYDLRSLVEIRRHAATIREWQGAERIFAPVFLDEDYGPEAIALRYKNYSAEGTEGFVQAYRSIWETGTGPIAAVLNDLAREKPEPILIHCTAGKDRTGVLCAIILALCGVDDETIANEYSLTEVGLAEFKDELLSSLLKNPTLKDNPEGAQRMLGAR